MYIIIAERSSTRLPTPSMVELISNQCSIDYKYNLLQSDLDNEFIKTELPNTTYQAVHREFS